MTLLETLNPRITWRTLLVVVSFFLLVAVVGLWSWDPDGIREIEARLRLGASEAEVIQLLAQPPDCVYDRATAPADYYAPGWFHSVPPITNRVLVFELSLRTCHVWIDARGRVEDFAVRGS